MRERSFRTTLSIALFLAGCAQEMNTSSQIAQPAFSSPEHPKLLFQSKETPRRELQRLGQEERRVPLIVLPGDALVFIDGQKVRRRNGLIDLVGKPGTIHHVRVSKDKKSTEEIVVKIEESGAFPALLDLNHEMPKQTGPAQEIRKPTFFNYDE